MTRPSVTNFSAFPLAFYDVKDFHLCMIRTNQTIIHDFSRGLLFCFLSISSRSFAGIEWSLPRKRDTTC